MILSYYIFYYIPGYIPVYPILTRIAHYAGYKKVFIFKLYVLFRIETYTFLPLYPPGYRILIIIFELKTFITSVRN